MLRPAVIVRTIAAVLVFLWAGAAQARVREIAPGEDWCGAIHSLSPGDELALRAGEYVGPCTIGRGGTPEAPVVLRAHDPAAPPHVVYGGRADNVLNVRAGHVVIRALRFGPTLPDVDAIRIHLGNGVTIEDCLFEDLGGIAVVANSATVRGLVVRRNTILRSRATALYFGCHDGLQCQVSDLLVERNYIHGVSAPAGTVGYGMQVKLNSTAVIRDNVIMDTKGPGIMVYGAIDPARTSLLERNLVAGSRTSAAIVVGGGPAIVRNNVALTSTQAGIALEDYAKRGLLRGVAIVHNTVYGNEGGGILAPLETATDVKVLNNAVHGLPGTPLFPNLQPGVLSLGNVNCSWLPCFVDPARRDFSPLSGSPLAAVGLTLGDAWMPDDDFFGRPRRLPPTVGAVEGHAGPIPLGVKRP